VTHHFAGTHDPGLLPPLWYLISSRFEPIVLSSWTVVRALRMVVAAALLETTLGGASPQGRLAFLDKGEVWVSPSRAATHNGRLARAP
jgi:hypothetical protein